LHRLASMNYFVSAPTVIILFSILAASIILPSIIIDNSSNEQMAFGQISNQNVIPNAGNTNQPITANGINANTGTSSTFRSNNISGNANVPHLQGFIDRVSGISALYPRSWRTSPLEYPALVSFSSPLDNLSDSQPARVVIQVIPYRQNISLMEYTNRTLMNLVRFATASNQSQSMSLLEQGQQTSNLSNQPQQRIQIKSADPITISGHPAYRVILSFLSPTTNGRTTSEVDAINEWTVVGNKVYSMLYTSDSSKFMRYLPDAMTIFHSVKLTNTSG
jgi:hypothetical protein